MSENRKDISKPFSIDSGVCSHIGRRRQNQDNTVSAPDGMGRFVEGGVFAVADGMGGQAGGCLASRLACDGLVRYLEKNDIAEKIRCAPKICRRLTEAVLRVDRYIRLEGVKDCDLEDMGTTLSCLVVTPTHSVIAHVGDTRVYRLREGFLTRLTVDHTFVQDMIFEGEVKPEKAHLHPLRNVLTRAVGTREPLELVDCRTDRLKTGDRFLLCSDGLYSAIEEKNIADLLSLGSPATETARQLVGRALQSGARDNITAIVVCLNRSGRTRSDDLPFLPQRPRESPR